MTEQSTKPADSLTTLIRELHDAVANDFARSKMNVSSVAACRSSHRQHTVRYKHLDVVDALASSDLPPSMWLSTAGATYVDALHCLSDLEMKVREEVRLVELLKFKIELLQVLDSANAGEAFDAPIKLLQAQLATQPLLDTRKACLNGLESFFKSSGDIDTKREALGVYLANFVDGQIDLVSEISGYSTHRSGLVMTARSMIHTAEALLAARPGSGSRQHPNEGFLHKSLQDDRILALAVTAYRQCAQEVAMHASGSTVGGTIEFAQSCLPIMTTPTDGMPISERSHVDYRLSTRFDRLKKRILDLDGYFKNQKMKHNLEDLERAKSLIRTVVGERTQAAA